MSVSIVVPVYNEVETIPHLYQRLGEVLAKLDREVEVIFVDDGSNDGSTEALRKVTKIAPWAKVIELRRNFGQTAAMHAGIMHATKDVIVTLDGDLQNEPDDIPMMLAKIDQGYDLVHGWRKNRQDAWLNRKLPSKIANWLISTVTDFPIHDLGCTMKAIRREIAQELELYGEMHRFIPILAHQRGARCVEVVTRHHPRKYGQTKYGIGRTTRVVLDLLTVTYMLRFFASPMKLFGRLGLACMGIAFASVTASVAMKFLTQLDMTGNPLLLFSVLTMILGTQFFGMGLIGEVNARIYYDRETKTPYAVRNLVNFTEDDHDASIPLKRTAA
ncbi:MAG: glycosyltransferase family 2 protein [Pirellulaceae bacterium]